MYNKACTSLKIVIQKRVLINTDNKKVYAYTAYQVHGGFLVNIELGDIELPVLNWTHWVSVTWTWHRTKSWIPSTGCVLYEGYMQEILRVYSSGAAFILKVHAVSDCLLHKYISLVKPHLRYSIVLSGILTRLETMMNSWASKDSLITRLSETQMTASVVLMNWTQVEWWLISHCLNL